MGCNKWISELAGWTGTWKEHDWKIGEEDTWQRSMWLDAFEWAKDEKLSHISAHPNVNLEEGNFNNQVDRMTYSMDSLFIQPSLPFFTGFMNKVAMVAEVEVIHRFNSMDFHSLGLACLQLLLSSRYASSKENHWVSNKHHLLWWPESDLVHCPGPIPLWKEQCLVLVGIDAYYGYLFAFPECDAYVKGTILDLQNSSCISMIFHTILLQTKELPSQPA